MRGWYAIKQMKHTKPERQQKIECTSEWMSKDYSVAQSGGAVEYTDCNSVEG